MKGKSFRINKNEKALIFGFQARRTLGELVILHH